MRRVLLKLSGEALMGEQEFGIEEAMLSAVVNAIKSACDEGVQVGIVVGGGNIFRGVQGSASGMNRNRADHMGMMATVMNALALSDALERAGQQVKTFCAIEMPRIMPLFHHADALAALNSGAVCIFAGGTANPFFTTDSAAALRAAELQVDEVLKGTQVDGVYEADPRKVLDARRYETVSFTTCLSKRLKVMDASAFAICQAEGIAVRVFNMHHENALKNALLGQIKGTLVGVGLEDCFAD
jgi:uridylate kinase